MPITARGGGLEGAPDWYGTPVDRLDFEWSEAEQLELEDYCSQIHLNLAEYQDKNVPNSTFTPELTAIWSR